MPTYAVAGLSRSRLIAACTIGALFFTAQDATVQLLLAFATYGAGFFLRPLGGVVLGAYADRKGRKNATLLTLFLVLS
jgi:MFS family permease